MKVLLAASEVAPIIKFGGLGDVVGALPKELAKVDVNIDIIVPFFPTAKTDSLAIYKKLNLSVPFNESIYKVEVWSTKLPQSDVDVLLLKNNDIFSRYAFVNPNGSLSDTEVFSFFDRCVVEYVKTQFNTYDLVHCNDWHTGLINHLLVDEFGAERPATLFTIHNLMYQGISSIDILKKIGLETVSHPLIEWDVADGDLNMMQQGISSSDYISTVSESYASEILSSEFGGHLSEVLKSRIGRLKGILNGVDYTAFPKDYDDSNWTRIKPEIKNKLLTKLGLANFRGPVFSFIGRLDGNQKGLDILLESVPYLMEKGVAFVLLGNGDPIWENKFKEIKGDTASINIMFDLELAKLIYSGSDFLLVPSKYEPCGLIQMISMWYGTLPIVHDVGGLKDSVKEGITGYKFQDYTANDLIKALDKALNDYDGHDYTRMVVNAMKEDFSWKVSAERYKKLYQDVINLRKGV